MHPFDALVVTVLIFLFFVFLFFLFSRHQNKEREKKETNSFAEQAPNKVELVQNLSD